MPQDLLANAKTSNTFAQVAARDTLNCKKEASSSSIKQDRRNALRKTAQSNKQQTWTKSKNKYREKRTSGDASYMGRKENGVLRIISIQDKFPPTVIPRWNDNWPCIVSCQESKHNLYCKVCKREVSCAKQGVRDVKVHMETNMHQKNAKAMKNQSTLFQACATAQNNQDKMRMRLSVEMQFLFTHFILHCT